VFGIVVTGSVGHTVQVEVEGLPKHIAVVIANPDMSIVPFTTTLTISVNKGAILGSIHST